MKQQIISDVMQQMLPHLDNTQLKELQKVLEYTLFGCEITKQEEKETANDNPKLVDDFVAAKRIEGCSEKTLKYYRTTIEAMETSIDKNIRHIQTEDLRSYLTDYQSKNQSSRVTIDNIRRILSSFFSWLEDEDYILKSPVRRIHKVKTATNIKETYTDEELEKMRDNCTELRDLAIIDMLASTGMRIGEMVLLNKADINFNERECVVFGKGDKERIVYFDARAKIHLQNYINSRTDDNPALFVTLRSPYDRIKIGGIEVRLREMGKTLNIEKVHPHKFRRTLATMAIDKGMPIEQLQQLLGHKRIDTTLQYAMVKQMNARINNLLKASVQSDGVINLFSDIDKEFSLFDPKFLEEVSKMKEKNLAVELLKKLIAEQVKIYRHTNIVKSEKFSEIIQRTMNAYLNGMLTNEQVIEELLNLAKQIAAAHKEGDQLGLTADELAFYDALTKPQAIKDFYENEELIAITKELADTLRKNRTIDWQKRDSARARMRMMIKRLLKKHRYPPEGMDDAVQTVMTQCELWTDNNDMELLQKSSKVYTYSLEPELSKVAEEPVPYGK